VEGFLAPIERIWEHAKYKGRGGCSIQRATVTPISKYFLSDCMTKSPFRFLVHPGAVNISEYIIFADFCKN